MNASCSLLNCARKVALAAPPVDRRPSTTSSRSLLSIHLTWAWDLLFGDRRVLRLIHRWLKAGVMEAGVSAQCFLFGFFLAYSRSLGLFCARSRSTACLRSVRRFLRRETASFSRMTDSLTLETPDQVDLTAFTSTQRVGS